MKYDVVCVGILVADVITKTVDTIPEKGKLGIVDSVRLYSGGGAMSTAVDLAKMGARTATIGKVGNDAFGDFLKNEMIKYGVCTKGIAVDESVGTSASVVLVSPDGERTFIHSVGTNGVFTDTDINTNMVNDTDVVFVTGISILPSFDGTPCARFLKKCKQMGKTTALDTAWDSQGRWMSILEESMEYIDYFMPSVDEAQCISGKTELSEIADCFFDKGVKSVILKLGKDGCYVRENAESEGYIVPSYMVEAELIADTTGAGDSFCAGFLYGLTHSMNIRESCKFANAVANHVVRSAGATSGVVSYEKIIEFMDSEDN